MAPLIVIEASGDFLHNWGDNQIVLVSCYKVSERYMLPSSVCPKKFTWFLTHFPIKFTFQDRINTKTQNSTRRREEWCASLDFRNCL